MQKLLMAICLFVFVQAAYSQPLPTLPPKSQTDSAALKKAKVKPVKTTVLADVNTQTIKFTADAECDIFIDGEAKGHLLAYGFLKTKLGKGQYMLQANGVNSSDVLREPFTVDEPGSERLYQINLQVVINNRVATEAANKQAEQQRQQELQQQANLQKEADRQQQAEVQRRADVQKKAELEKQAEQNRQAGLQMHKEQSEQWAISHKTEMEKLNFILVEGGHFNMGGTDDQASALPVHSISLASFYMSKYEVTTADFRKFIQATGYITTAEKDGKSEVAVTVQKGEQKVGVNWQYDGLGQKRNPNRDNEPVIHVSWEDCTHYCQWMTEQSGKSFRLPTEAEWEYAARGGNKSNGFKYAGGSDRNEVAWYYDNARKTTHEVGQKKPNELGLYDMTGNVWEWCSDWYDENYYASSPNQNPQGNSTGTKRVIRGGCWYNRNFSLFLREGSEPSYHGNDYGFRPVVSF